MNASLLAQLQHIRAARTLDEMLSAVATMRDMDSLAAIPPLAALDRRAAGWVQISITWLAALVWAAVQVLATLALLCVCWFILLVLGLTLAWLMHPGWGETIAILLTCVTFAIVLCDPRFVAQSATLYTPTLSDYKQPLRAMLWTLRLLSLLALALSITAQAMLAIMPLLLLTLAAAYLFPVAIANFTTFGGPLALPIAGGLILGLALVLIDIRRLVRGAPGDPWLMLLGWTLISYPWRQEIPLSAWAIRLIAIVSLYWLLRQTHRLFGRAFTLSHLLCAPYLWLHLETLHLVKQAELRHQLRLALRAHRRRNQAAVGRDWRQAVCRRCMARCELCAVRLAYWRRLEFARCRICHDDTACYSGVRSIAGLIGAAEPGVVDDSDTLRIDLTPSLSASNRPLPHNLDRIIIGAAGDRLVETFLIRYQEQEARIDLPALQQIACIIMPSSTISENTRRMLQASFGQVRSDESQLPPRRSR
jgi:hypothetical protein